MHSRATVVRSKILLQIPRVAFGLLGWLTIGALLPRGPAWVLLIVLITGAIASLVAQLAVVRLIWWAWGSCRRLDDGTVVVTATRLPYIQVAGRSILVVPQHLSAEDHFLNYARALQRVAATGWDVLAAWFAWPWDRVAITAGWMGRLAARLPLVGWAWSIRWLVAGIAVIQSAAAGRIASSVIIAAVVGLSYWVPWSRARWLQAAHAATLELMPPIGPDRDPVSVRSTNHRALTASRHHYQAGDLPSQRWHDRHQQIAHTGRLHTQ